MRQSFNGITEAEPDTRFASHPPPAGGARSFLGWAVRAVPTLLILGGLAGLAVWGHHTGWQFSATAGGEGSGGPQEAAHWVEIAPEGARPGWCPRHGVHACPLCDPAVAQVTSPPRITPADRERADRGLAFRQRPGNNPNCTLHRKSVRFKSEDAAARAGIDVAPVYRTSVTESAAAPGEVAYDATRLARVSVRAPGTVWRVLKRLGDRVTAGEVLACVDSADVGKAKAEFVQGYLQVAVRGRTLRDLTSAGSAVTPRQRREAEAAHREAQVRLAAAEQALANLGLPMRAEDFREVKAEDITRRIQFLGLPDALVKSLDREATANLIPVRAPFAGEVIAADVVAGEVVETGKVLFTVADVGRMWVHLNVAARDAPLVRPGQKVVFRPDGEKADVTGVVGWVSTSADERTRTVRVRAELANPARRLRSGALGAGQVVLREEPQAVVVPSESVQSDGDCHFVFVRDKGYLKPDGPKVFHVRTVRPGARNGEYTEVIAGLWPDEVVVSKGAASLRSEVQRNLVGPAQSGRR